MFGYVKIRRGDLRVKEFECYKAIYCGLCHHQKKLSRRLRYSLSYDMVFLALLRIGTAGERLSFSKKRCLAHPFRPRLTVESSESLRYTAGVSAILLYYKLIDDIADERGVRRLLAKCMLHSAEKAMRQTPLLTLEERVKDLLQDLSAVEARQSGNVYDGADCFGKLLGEVFAYGEEEDKQKALFELGRRIGRYIYLLDAYADRKEDAEEEKYNPFVLSKEALESERFQKNLITALDMEMLEAARALEALAIEDGGIHAILQNIVKLGLGDTARRVIMGGDTKDKLIQEERGSYESKSL